MLQWSLMGVKGFETMPKEMADKGKLLFSCIYFHLDSNLVEFDYFIDPEPRRRLGWPWLKTKLSHTQSNK